MYIIKKLRIAVLLLLITALSIPYCAYMQGGPASVSAYAGSGENGFSDGALSKASFSLPAGIAADKDGGIIIADSYNNRIRRIKNGSVTTLAGCHDTLDAYGFPRGGYIDGDAAKAQFNDPRDIAVDSKGNIYVADTGNNSIRRISGGKVYTYAGTGKAGYADGKVSQAQFNSPEGMAIDKDDNLYIADSLNNVIRKVTPDGYVSTVAGRYQTDGSFMDGPANTALFNEPSDVGLDKAGSLYILDCGNQLVRKLSGGQVSTYSGKMSGKMPDTNYITGGFADGSAKNAMFNFPKGMFVTDDGVIFVADTWNHRIRAIKPDGSVITLLGTGTPGKDNTTPAESTLNGPAGVLYLSGSLYISDMWNNLIRVMPVDLKNLTQTVDIEGIDFEASSGKPQLWLDKQEVAFTGAQPYFADGKTMIPIAALCEKLGAKAEYSAADKQVIIERNGSRVILDCIKDSVVIKDNTAFVHVRVLSEKLGLKLDWISAYNAVVISTK